MNPRKLAEIPALIWKDFLRFQCALIFLSALTRSLLKASRLGPANTDCVSLTSLLMTSLIRPISLSLEVRPSFISMRAFWPSRRLRRSWYRLLLLSPMLLISFSIKAILLIECYSNLLSSSSLYLGKESSVFYDSSNAWSNVFLAKEHVGSCIGLWQLQQNLSEQSLASELALYYGWANVCWLDCVTLLIELCRRDTMLARFEKQDSLEGSPSIPFETSSCMRFW